MLSNGNLPIKDACWNHWKTVAKREIELITILRQETYDLLIDRLDANHMAHKCISPFEHIKRTIERTARITLDGVEVNSKALDIAYTAIQSNVDIVGKRYQTGFDEILLFDLDEAINALPQINKEGF